MTANHATWQPKPASPTALRLRVLVAMAWISAFCSLDLAPAAPGLLDGRAQAAVAGVNRDMPGRIERALAAKDAAGTVTVAAISGELERLGPAAIPDLVELLVLGRLDGAATFAGMEAVQFEAVFSVVERQGNGTILPLLRKWSLLDDPKPNAVVTLRLLGSYGNVRDIDLALRLARPAESLGVQGDELSHALRCSLEQILRREAILPSSLRKLVLGCGPVLQRACVDVIGRLTHLGAVGELCGLLRQDLTLDEHILHRLLQAVAGLQEQIEPSDLESLRLVLSGNDPEQLVLAAHILALLEDSIVAPGLVDLLEHEDSAVGAASEQALAMLGRCHFKGNRARWKAWITSEEDWFETRFGELIALLHSRGLQLIDAQAALAELAAHPLYRRNITGNLLSAFAGSRPAIQELLCSTLLHLNARGTTAGLLPMLEDLDPDVKHAAWQALRCLTGLDLPLDPTLWRHSLRPQSP
jgi:hypothetical protein